jgi:hypothetical protein
MFLHMDEIRLFLTLFNDDTEEDKPRQTADIEKGRGAGIAQWYSTGFTG